MKKGKFITIEGLEGAGKSTQIEYICSYLQLKGIEVVKTREPGGSDIGEKIRKLLLDDEFCSMHSDTELLLMFSARNEHINQKIKPALAIGKWVVSDRFTDSSFAYQGGGRLIDMSRIKELENWVQKDFRPDLTFFLDVGVNIGMNRIKNRLTKDRIEQERNNFFERVRNIFIERANKYPQRIKLIDASTEIKKVKTQIIKYLEEL